MKYIILFAVLSIAPLYLYLLYPRSSRRNTLLTIKKTMFAHRGYHCAEKYIPENSMAAFQAALSKGYGIELDLHLTKDQKLVVFHDDTLDRMCRVPGTIEDMTYDQISRLRLQNTSEHIPLFSEVLAYVNGRVPLLIELKIPGSANHICGFVYEELQSYTGLYLIQSFHTMGLRWFRIHAPEVLRGQLSCNLLKSESKEPWICRFFVTHLLCNILGRPDFISYKQKDLPSFGVSVCRSVFKTPVAVWTLRTENALDEGLRNYQFQIFEKACENY